MSGEQSQKHDIGRVETKNNHHEQIYIVELCIDDEVNRWGQLQYQLSQPKQIVWDCVEGVREGIPGVEHKPEQQTLTNKHHDCQASQHTTHNMLGGVASQSLLIV